MKKNIAAISLLLILLTGCSKPEPSQYVMTAFINANLLANVNSESINNELVNPPQQYTDAGKGGFITIKRTVYIEQKIDQATAILGKINSLPDDAEAKPMVEASKKLFETAVAAYKNECMQLAQLYDQNAAAEQITAKKNQLGTAYDLPLQQQYDELGKLGMAYAEKHQVRVLNVQTTPR